MNKFLGSVLMFLLYLAAIGAAVYAVVTYWDKIVVWFNTAKDKVTNAVSATCTVECDDYADWDD